VPPDVFVAVLPQKGSKSNHKEHISGIVNFRSAVVLFTHLPRRKTVDSFSQKCKAEPHKLWGRTLIRLIRRHAKIKKQESQVEKYLEFVIRIASVGWEN